MDTSQNLLISQIATILLKQNARLVSTESCTGGQIASCLTQISGSSQWFECGLVTYSNQSKQQLLDVAVETLNTYGAVSEQTVIEMVQGAIKKYAVDYSLAVSGIAGPSGGTEEKPVGTIYFAWGAKSKKPKAIRLQLSGDRQQIQAQAVNESLQGLLRYIESN